jgi:hypothetical protein
MNINELELKKEHLKKKIKVLRELWQDGKISFDTFSVENQKIDTEIEQTIDKIENLLEDI